MHKIIYYFTLINLIIACTNSRTQSNTIPKNIQWNSNTYAKLFKIGFTSTDTFLAILNPEDNSQSIQIIQKRQIAKYPKIATGCCALAKFLDLINESESVVCVDNANYYSYAPFNQLPSFNSNGQLNIELLHKSKTQYIFNSQLLPKSQVTKLQKFNIQPIYFFNHLEHHPLASAEWIKVAAFFFSANTSIFESEIAAFHNLIDTNILSIEIPVLINAPYQGNWFIPHNQSTFGTLLRYAGFYSVPKISGYGSSVIALEKIFSKAQNVKYWFNPGLCANKQQLLQLNPQFSKFKPFHSSTIVNNTRKLNSITGTNPYFEIIDTQPSKILKDLLHIRNNQLDSLSYFNILD